MEIFIEDKLEEAQVSLTKLTDSKVEYSYKIIIIGDSAVGKTSVIRRATTDVFDNEYVVTLGAEFAYLDFIVDQKVVRLNIWDTVRTQPGRTGIAQVGV